MKTPIEGKVLGKQIAYPDKYAPEILVAVPRSLNRTLYKLDEAHLPFCGEDVWHAYELGFLTKTGLPVSGVLKLVYPASSVSLVESKSLKLYLNSFNMERFGTTVSQGIEAVLETIQKDLSHVLNTNIKLSFFNQETGQLPFDFTNFEILEYRNEMESVQFNTYSETPALLVPGNFIESELNVGTHLLRSNCKITHQPDWGSAFIHIKGNKLPDYIGLLKYLVSIRNENHFHEEICEMIYKRLWDAFSPTELMVACIYTRRGGIDICPARASHEALLPQHLVNSNGLSTKLMRQ
jgi:7-cyano-7-deazaguanine reductase